MKKFSKSDRLIIAKACRIHRAAQRISQAELGEDSKTNQRTVSYLEAEAWGKISDSNIEKIRKIVLPESMINYQLTVGNDS